MMSDPSGGLTLKLILLFPGNESDEHSTPVHKSRRRGSATTSSASEEANRGDTPDAPAQMQRRTLCSNGVMPLRFRALGP